MADELGLRRSNRTSRPPNAYTPSSPPRNRQPDMLHHESNVPRNQRRRLVREHENQVHEARSQQLPAQFAANLQEHANNHENIHAPGDDNNLPAPVILPPPLMMEPPIILPQLIAPPAVLDKLQLCRAYGIWNSNSEDPIIVAIVNNKLKRCKWVQSNMPTLFHALTANLLEESTNEMNIESKTALKLQYGIRQFEIETATMNAIKCPICTKITVVPGIFLETEIRSENPLHLKHCQLTSKHAYKQCFASCLYICEMRCLWMVYHFRLSLTEIFLVPFFY